jgi:hypothetical protein
VQLDDAVDDTLLWSKRYDVAAKDVERLAALGRLKRGPYTECR